MKQKPQKQAFDVNHYGFMFPQLAVLVSIEIQIPVFLESLFWLSAIGLKGHIKEDINLGWDLPVVWDNLDFIDFYWSIKLKCDLL